MIQQGQHGPAVQLDDAPKAEEATKSDDAADMLPASGTGPTLFKASFSGNDLGGLAHEKLGWVPPMSLSFDFGWRVDPAGSGVGLDWKPTVTGPEGQVSTIMKTLPAQPAIGSAAPKGVGVFLTVDLLQAPFVPAPVRAALGAAPENR